MIPTMITLLCLIWSTEQQVVCKTYSANKYDQNIKVENMTRPLFQVPCLKNNSNLLKLKFELKLHVFMVKTIFFQKVQIFTDFSANIWSGETSNITKFSTNVLKLKNSVFKKNCF